MVRVCITKTEQQLKSNRASVIKNISIWSISGVYIQVKSQTINGLFHFGLLYRIDLDLAIDFCYFPWHSCTAEVGYLLCFSFDPHILLELFIGLFDLQALPELYTFFYAILYRVRSIW